MQLNSSVFQVDVNNDDDSDGESRAAESVAAQQRRCELSKGLVSRARMLYANSESNREPERARASKREPERAGEQHLKHASTLFFFAKQLNTTLFCC